MANTRTAGIDSNDRWGASSAALRMPIEAILLPVSRWGTGRGRKTEQRHRSAAVERRLQQGDYIHD